MLETCVCFSGKSSPAMKTKVAIGGASVHFSATQGITNGAGFSQKFHQHLQLCKSQRLDAKETQTNRPNVSLDLKNRGEDFKSYFLLPKKSLRFCLLLIVKNISLLGLTGGTTKSICFS